MEKMKFFVGGLAICLIPGIFLRGKSASLPDMTNIFFKCYETRID